MPSSFDECPLLDFVDYHVREPDIACSGFHKGNYFQKMETISSLEGRLQETVIFWLEIKNNYFSEGNQIAEKTGKLEGGI